MMLLVAMEQSKRVSKEPRATNKRQRTTAGDDNDKATGMDI